MNRLVWDLRHERVPCIEDHFALDWDGPRAAPGWYHVRLTVNGTTREVPFEVRGDPRVPIDEAG